MSTMIFESDLAWSMRDGRDAANAELRKAVSLNSSERNRKETAYKEGILLSHLSQNQAAFWEPYRDGMMMM